MSAFQSYPPPNVYAHLLCVQITHRDTINDIGDLGAALIVKGRYYKPGDRIPEGERKLYLVIEGG